MTMILDAFMSKFSQLLVHMVEKEVGVLLGVPGEIEKLQLHVGDIQCVIADAEKRRTESLSIDRWLKELTDVMYDADDIMDLCQIKVEERLDRSSSPSSSKISCGFPHLLSCFRNPAFAHEIGIKIQEINSRLEGIAKRMVDMRSIEMQAAVDTHPISRVDSVISSETDQLAVMEDIVGEKIEEDAELLVSWLTEEESGVGGKIGVVAIVGMGGIGKTTLAKRVFNDHRVEFKLKLWACVSKKAKALELLKSIIEQAGGELGATQTRAVLVRKLEEAVKEKKFLVILDDVWFESQQIWVDLLRTPMSAGAHGSRLLVTTRDERVVNFLGATKSHHVEKMSLKDDWSLLIKQVLGHEEESRIREFKDIGLNLVEKCDGLPLAIKSIGGVLRMKNKTIEEWQAILKSNVWSKKKQLSGIHHAFYLSYEDLSSYLKQCFIFCSLYPDGYLYQETHLICQWFAEGFLQGTDPWELGKEYYKELLERNLLEDYEYSGTIYSKMHDLLWSFAHHLGKDENYILTEEKVLDRQGSVAKLRRLAIQGNKVNLKVVMKEKGLRTLLIDDIDDIPEHALADLCTTLPKLRILDMSVSSTSILPNYLSRLVHLRSLNVTNSKVRNIPESIGCLRNLIYLNFSHCKELRHVPQSITNLHKLMFLSFYGTEVDGIPTGLKNLGQLKVLLGFKPSNNSLEMFNSLDELKALSHLVDLQLKCLERVIDQNMAKEAELCCKNQLQKLALEYTMLSSEDKAPQTDERKETTKGVLNQLRPPSSLEILKIRGYFGNCLPDWLNLGTTLSMLRFFEIKDCNYFENLGSLGQLPNLEFLRIVGAFCIRRIGEEFLWGEIKDRDIDMVAKSFRVIPAFSKLNQLDFDGMPNWGEWQWNEREKAMPKLKKLCLQSCPNLRSLPEGLVRHATSLECLEICDAISSTTIENFPSINDFHVVRNPTLERISNMPNVSNLLIVRCPNLKIVEKLSALQRLELWDFDMNVLPEYLVTVMPYKLRIICNEELLRKITSQGESGSERQKFKHIPKVTIKSWDKSLYATYEKTPFSFTTNIRT